MVGGYIIEDGEIKISLDESDFLSLVGEVEDCADILAPHIRISDNFIIFRDRDVKLIIPEELFGDKVPEYKVPTTTKVLWGKIAIAIFTLCALTCYMMDKNFQVLYGMLLWGGAFFGIILSSYYFHLREMHVTRYRKALYIKAKLITYLMMIFTQDITTTNGRLSRTNDRHVTNIGELKEMVKTMYHVIPEGSRKLHIGESFPDGEPICTKRIGKFS